jgi:hypothetical protein
MEEYSMEKGYYDFRYPAAVRTTSPLRLDEDLLLPTNGGGGGASVLDQHSAFLSDVLGCSSEDGVTSRTTDSSISSKVPVVTPRRGVSFPGGMLQLDSIVKRPETMKPAVAGLTTHEDSNPSRTTAPSCSSGSKRTRKRETSSASPGGVRIPPNRPRSSYIIFLKSIRDSNLEAVKKRGEKMMKMEMLLKVVDSQWNALPPERREVFEKLAVEDTTRYQCELDEYHRSKSSNREKKIATQNDAEVIEAPRPSKMKKHGSHPPLVLEEPTKMLEQRQNPGLSTFIPVSAGMNHSSHPSSLCLGMLPGPCDPSSANAIGGHLPLPQGTELELTHQHGGLVIPGNHQKRRYRVQYKCLEMTKGQAEEYFQGILGAGNQNGSHAGPHQG